jgi:Fe-S-cluster-containing hydrogenase component 2
MIIVENPEACTGCLICVLACSFHHTRKYSRSQSSIEVNKSIFTQEKRAAIAICHKKEKRIPVCDMCKEEDFPLCIQFCPENVFKVKRR